MASVGALPPSVENKICYEYPDDVLHDRIEKYVQSLGYILDNCLHGASRISMLGVVNPILLKDLNRIIVDYGFEEDNVVVQMILDYFGLDQYCKCCHLAFTFKEMGSGAQDRFRLSDTPPHNCSANDYSTYYCYDAEATFHFWGLEEEPTWHVACGYGSVFDFTGFEVTDVTQFDSPLQEYDRLCDVCIPKLLSRGVLQRSV